MLTPALPPQLWHFAPLRAKRFLPRMAKREQSGVVKKHPFQGRTAARQPSESNLQATLVVL